MRRLGAAVAAVVAVVLLTAAPAAAHAELTGTEPPSGAVLERPPARVELSFSEAVEVSLGSIRIYDAAGDRRDAGRARHPEGRANAVAVDLPAFGPGTYVATWRVISADSHPVHGAFTFRVGSAGAAGDSQALARRLLAAEGGSTTVGAVFGIVRFATFAALILLVGGMAFVLTLWPTGRAMPPVRRLLAGAWVLSIVTTASAIALQGVYAGGLPLGDALRWSVIDSVLDTRYGRASLARLVLLAVAGVLVGRLLRKDRVPTPWRLGALAVVGAAVLVTPGIAGHPGTDQPAALAVGLDAVHLGAVSLWLGGLTVLAAVVLRRAEPTVMAEIVPKFSRLALVAVAVILATGATQAWRQARSIDAVTDTTYGRLVLIKLGLFLGIVALAAVSRSWVRRRRAVPVLVDGPGAMAGTPPEVGRLRRAVAGEVGVAVAVLAVTALLVNSVPARTALAQPFSTELSTAHVLIDVTVDPAKAGPADVHVYTLSRAGAVTDVEEVTAQLTLADKDIGPLAVPLRRAGPGHFAAYGFDIPIPGTWRLEVTARTSDIDQSSAATSLRIR